MNKNFCPNQNAKTAIEKSLQETEIYTYSPETGSYISIGGARIEKHNFGAGEKQVVILYSESDLKGLKEFGCNRCQYTWHGNDGICPMCHQPATHDLCPDCKVYCTKRFVDGRCE